MVEPQTLTLRRPHDVSLVVGNPGILIVVRRVDLAEGGDHGEWRREGRPRRSVQMRNRVATRDVARRPPIHGEAVGREVGISVVRRRAIAGWDVELGYGVRGIPRARTAAAGGH